MHILLIGGGANGVAAFIHLVSESIIAKRSIQLTLVERSGVIGEGLAFGTKQPGHLLNTPSGLMGIHPHEPGHYSKWLTSNRHRVSEEEIKQFDTPDDSYTTRRLYSDYLRSSFSTYTKIARDGGISVDCVRGEALDVRADDNGYSVFVEGKGWLSCDLVVMAPGTPEPDNYPELNSSEKYIGFPWPEERLIGIPSGAKAAILGTSLSAVDAVMTLADNGHAGKIMLASPDGLLPRVQPRKESRYTCRYLTLPRVHKIRRKKLRSPTAVELLQLFRKEVDRYNGNASPWVDLNRRGKDHLELLNRDIAVAEQGGDALLNIAYATRELSAQVWEWLSVEEKDRFKRRLGVEWMINRHAMPVHNARRIRSLIAKGTLRVYGRLTGVKHDQGGFRISCDGSTYIADYVVNATGPGSSLKEMKSRLIDNLRQSGVIESYPSGGIQIDTQTMQVVSRNHRTEGIYAIGHIANGMLIDSNAVWFNVQTIAAMVRHILNRGSDHS